MSYSVMNYRLIELLSSYDDTLHGIVSHTLFFFHTYINDFFKEIQK